MGVRNRCRILCSLWDSLFTLGLSRGAGNETPPTLAVAFERPGAPESLSQLRGSSRRTRAVLTLVFSPLAEPLLGLEEVKVTSFGVNVPCRPMRLRTSGADLQCTCWRSDGTQVTEVSTAHFVHIYTFSLPLA